MQQELNDYVEFLTSMYLIGKTELDMKNETLYVSIDSLMPFITV